MIIRHGDCIDVMAEMPSGTVQCAVTSPPYFGLRDYGVSGQIGLEDTPDAYVARLVEVFREVRRVLKDDGVMFLNLGDCYGSGKQLQFIPTRVAMALQVDGWIARSEIVWAKPNPMPESVRDRPTSAHEKVFLLTKAPRYFYDADAIRESAVATPRPETSRHKPTNKWAEVGNAHRGGNLGFNRPELGRNCRNVWTITPKPFRGAHVAVMPEGLAERCIKAGSRIGDVVFDPFSGSGTTAKMALLTGRRFIGCDISAEYVEIARRRVDAARQELGLFAAE